METKLKSEVLNQFKEASKSLVNPALSDWREKGGKVVGCFCSYVPEEIITAAGMLPFRMRATGSTSTELADTYLSQNNCSFARHCLNMGLTGEFDFIDGAVWLNTCDHVRRVYDNWTRKVDTPFVHMISLPRKTGEEQVKWLWEEFVNFKQAMESHFDIKITDDAIRESIRSHNETKQLQKRLYDLRKDENPPITGAETLAVMVAGTAMPKELYNRLLSRLLDELHQIPGHTDFRARVMITGGILDNPAYIETIEDAGALVVTDSLCFGSRVCWVEVDEEAENPIEALARYHILDRPACPRMFGQKDQRSDYVHKMIRDFNVAGVIGERIVFCDYWSGEHYMLGKEFKEEKFPFLKLDREYSLDSVGQLRTRVQAFIETLEGGKP